MKINSFTTNPYFKGKVITNNRSNAITIAHCPEEIQADLIQGINNFHTALKNNSKESDIFFTDYDLVEDIDNAIWPPIVLPAPNMAPNKLKYFYLSEEDGVAPEVIEKYNHRGKNHVFLREFRASVRNEDGCRIGRERVFIDARDTRYELKKNYPRTSLCPGPFNEVLVMNKVIHKYYGQDKDIISDKLFNPLLEKIAKKNLETKELPAEAQLIFDRLAEIPENIKVNKKELALAISNIDKDEPWSMYTEQAKRLYVENFNNLFEDLKDCGKEIVLPSLDNFHYGISVNFTNSVCHRYYHNNCYMYLDPRNFEKEFRSLKEYLCERKLKPETQKIYEQLK